MLLYGLVSVLCPLEQLHSVAEVEQDRPMKTGSGYQAHSRLWNGSCHCPCFHVRFCHEEDIVHDVVHSVVHAESFPVHDCHLWSRDAGIYSGPVVVWVGEVVEEEERRMAATLEARLLRLQL